MPDSPSTLLSCKVYCFTTPLRVWWGRRSFFVVCHFARRPADHQKRWSAPQSGIAATDVGRTGTCGPTVNRTSRADARLMTPEGVIAGQKARPHVKAAAACGNPLEQRRNRATVILCPAGQPNA